MNSSEWSAAYTYNRDGEVLVLELDVRSGVTGKPPAKMSLEPKSSGDKYVVNGTAINECEWNATYNSKKSKECMELELEVRSGITGKPPAKMNLEQNSSGDRYIVKGS